MDNTGTPSPTIIALDNAMTTFATIIPDIGIAALILIGGLSTIVNNNYSPKLPTSNQLRYIALLSMKLHIPEPHVETFGEAGRLINEYKKELEYRKTHKKIGV